MNLSIKSKYIYKAIIVCGIIVLLICLYFTIDLNMSKNKDISHDEWVTPVASDFNPFRFDFIPPNHTYHLSGNDKELAISLLRNKSYIKLEDIKESSLEEQFKDNELEGYIVRAVNNGGGITVRFYDGNLWVHASTLSHGNPLEKKAPLVVYVPNKITKLYVTAGSAE